MIDRRWSALLICIIVKMLAVPALDFHAATMGGESEAAHGTKARNIVGKTLRDKVQVSAGDDALVKWALTAMTGDRSVRVQCRSPLGGPINDSEAEPSPERLRPLSAGREVDDLLHDPETHGLLGSGPGESELEWLVGDDH